MYSRDRERDYLDYGVQGGSAVVGGGLGLVAPQMIRSRIERGKKAVSGVPNPDVMPQKGSQSYKDTVKDIKDKRKSARALARKTQNNPVNRAIKDLGYYDPRKAIASKQQGTLWRDLAGRGLSRVNNTQGIVNKGKVLASGVGGRLAPAGRLAMSPLGAFGGWHLSKKAMDALRRTGYTQ